MKKAFATLSHNMLCEIAITPDVLSMQCDNLHPDVHDICLRQLKDFLVEAAIVRDLRDGEWSHFMSSEKPNLPLRAKELLKKLKQIHLRRVPAASPSKPASDLEWCKEAIGSARENPGLTGIITLESTIQALTDQESSHQEEMLAAMNKVPSAQWWPQTKSAIRLHRRTGEYLKHLALTLECSTHVAFIDPNINPSKRGYDRFLELILRANNEAIIEIHRGLFDGNGSQKRKMDREIFGEWNTVLRKHDRKVEVCLWPEIHDRYLITNLVGILVPYGFDNEQHENMPKTTWCRLPRAIRDEVELGFDPQKASDEFSLGNPN